MGIQDSWIFNIVSPLFITLTNVWKGRTLWGCPYLFMFHIDRPIARISSSLVLDRVPRSCSFTLAKRSYSNGLRRKRHIWWFSTLSLFMIMQESHTAAVTDRADGNGRFPLWLHPVLHKRLNYPCYRAINTEYQQKRMRWWCTTPSKH